MAQKIRRSSFIVEVDHNLEDLDADDLQGDLLDIQETLLEAAMIAVRNHKGMSVERVAFRMMLKPENPIQPPP